MRLGPQGYVVPGAYRAVCLRVVDGDTFEALVDLGFRAYQRATLRVAGINAPETHGPEAVRAARATARLVELLGPRPADFAGWPLRLDVHSRDPYGRWVAAVHSVAAGQEVDVGAVLLAEGLAAVYAPKRDAIARRGTRAASAVGAAEGRRARVGGRSRVVPAEGSRAATAVSGTIDRYTRHQIRALGLPTIESMLFQRQRGALRPTPESVAAARAFVLEKWRERAALLGDAPPDDLADACTFASIFALLVFGGNLCGNEQHQFVQLPNCSILDLTGAAGVPVGHETMHDAAWWGNPDHEVNVASVAPRVARWVAEFRARRSKLSRVPRSSPPPSPSPERR